MKCFKAAIFLALAASTMPLGANDFSLNWSNGVGGTATGIMSININQLNNPGVNNFRGPTSPNAWFNSLSITIAGHPLHNGTYTGVAALDIVATPIDLSAQIVGQPGFFVLDYDIGDHHWAAGGVGIGSLNVPGAPNLLLTSFIVIPSGVSNLTTWMSSLAGANRAYTIGTTLAGLPLEGTHHRPLLSFDRLGEEAQAWAAGDFGSSSNTRDVHVTSGEAGINWNVGKTMLFGVAGGHAVQNQDLAFNGSSATKGDFVLAELDYRPEGTQWIVSLLGMVGSWESKTNRGYDNGAGTDFSSGVADTITRSARLRVDAPAVATFGGFGFAPYASYSVTQTIVGAHTETGGAFPASFNEQEHNATEGRVGVTASKDLSEKTKLLLSVEGIHRFDGVGPALTGQDITGGVTFDLPGTAVRPDCVRFGFDVDHKLSAYTLVNISAHVSTVGEAHDVSAAISIRRAF